jgi:hypothetical protein
MTGDTAVQNTEPESPEELQKSATTNAEELWKQNEKLFHWILSKMQNYLLKTVPGGGKSYCKEKIVPKLAAKTDRTFVLATTEYRNRQSTYRAVLETLIEEDLIYDVEVAYVPSPREVYGNIPKLSSDESDGWKITMPDDEEAVCQTFTEKGNDYVYNVAEDIDKRVSRGASTRAVHDAALDEWKNIVGRKIQDREYPLVCQERGKEKGYDPEDREGKPACRHQRMKEGALDKASSGNVDIIIGGASLLYIDEVVEDATVIADEDIAGELFNTRKESYLDDAVDNFLNTIETDLEGYKTALNASEEVKSSVAECIRESHDSETRIDEEDDKEPLVDRKAPLQSSCEYSRAEAPLLSLALLEGKQTEKTNHIVFNTDDVPDTVAIDLESGGGNNNHEPVAIANPPKPLQDAEQVIALDATGSEDWWETLTGIQFNSTSPNPAEERGTVVSEAFDIEFRALTENMVPINRPNSLSAREFLGILQAITDYHDKNEISIVTSKKMKEKLEESRYHEEVMELAYADEILHFGGLRSERAFEESQLHVVIGAPHPGDDQVRQRMAMLGCDAEIIQDDQDVVGEDRYRGYAKDVLHDIVHSEVYQAARRAAREVNQDEEAHVYLYTSMFNEDQIQADHSFAVNIIGAGEKIENGTECLMKVLEENDTLSTECVHKEVNSRLDEEMSRTRVTEKLNEMLSKGLIEKQSWFQNKNRWTATGTMKHGMMVSSG